MYHYHATMFLKFRKDRTALQNKTMLQGAVGKPGVFGAFLTMGTWDGVAFVHGDTDHDLKDAIETITAMDGIVATTVQVAFHVHEHEEPIPIG